MRDKIEKILQERQKSPSKEASTQLSARYRNADSHESEEQVLAYLAVRLPATFAVCIRVFQELAKFLSPTSLLDLGAGPGTGSWAARDIFPGLKNVTCVERDPTFIEWGRRLAKEESVLQDAKWLQKDFRTLEEFPDHDVSLFSYSFNESPDLAPLLRSWSQCNKALVLIEPGTPKGYRNILTAREALIRQGAFISAPCPHEKPCPLAHTNDWCHFATRLERSSLHRTTKGAQLAYEDEKYSYLIATKEPFSRGSRIIHTPQKRSGHVNLSLCASEGLTMLTLSKKNKDLYREAKKAEWGDTWES